jgi:cytochrome c5
MSTTEHHDEHNTEGHEGPIKTPRQLIVTVVLAFIVPVIIIIMLTHLVASSVTEGSGSNAQTPEAIAERIKPVASFALVDANAPKVMKTGQQVFESTCTACHSSGAAGAPKVGDKAAWAPYIAKGYDDMIKKAISGVNAMPPKGGNPSLSDFEIARAVAYMANKSGASFEEPKEPAADKPAEKTADAAPAAMPAAAAPAAAPAPAAPAAAPAKQAAAESKPAAQPASATIDPAGEKLYKSVCFACHATGAAGAPTFGDKQAWAKYIETGLDTMVQKAISGVNAMPPRGGSQASDDEMRAAVQYMVHAAQ